MLKKSDLLATMKTNRDAHRETFLEAQKLYRMRVIEELDKRLAAARNGGRIDLGFHLPEPVDYTGDYDDAIQRVEWDVREQIELDDTEFRQFVLNKWGWDRLFAQNTASYLAGSV